MRTALIALAALSLTACAAVQETVSTFRPAPTAEQSAERARLQNEREQQRQFERCMKITLGKFADFQSPAMRIKAAEACKDKPQP